MHPLFHAIAHFLKRTTPSHPWALPQLTTASNKYVANGKREGGLLIKNSLTWVGVVHTKSRPTGGHEKAGWLGTARHKRPGRMALCTCHQARTPAVRCGRQSPTSPPHATQCGSRQENAVLVRKTRSTDLAEVRGVALLGVPPALLCSR